MLCRSSTSCAIGVVLHLREKIYFIVKGSSTAPKGTKTVFSFRHPKSPQKQQKCLGYPKKASRAHYIYNESVEKFHLIYKKVSPMTGAHRLRCGLPGYLILFDSRTFEPQRQ